MDTIRLAVKFSQKVQIKLCALSNESSRIMIAMRQLKYSCCCHENSLHSLYHFLQHTSKHNTEISTEMKDILDGIYKLVQADINNFKSLLIDIKSAVTNLFSSLGQLQAKRIEFLLSKTIYEITKLLSRVPQPQEAGPLLLTDALTILPNQFHYDLDAIIFWQSSFPSLTVTSLASFADAYQAYLTKALYLRPFPLIETIYTLLRYTLLQDTIPLINVFDGQILGHVEVTLADYYTWIRKYGPLKDTLVKCSVLCTPSDGRVVPWYQKNLTSLTAERLIKVNLQKLQATTTTSQLPAQLDSPRSTTSSSSSSMSVLPHHLVVVRPNQPSTREEKHSQVDFYLTCKLPDKDIAGLSSGSSINSSHNGNSSSGSGKKIEHYPVINTAIGYKILLEPPVVADTTIAVTATTAIAAAADQHPSTDEQDEQQGQSSSAKDKDKKKEKEMMKSAANVSSVVDVVGTTSKQQQQYMTVAYTSLYDVIAFVILPMLYPFASSSSINDHNSSNHLIFLADSIQQWDSLFFKALISLPEEDYSTVKALHTLSEEKILQLATSPTRPLQRNLNLHYSSLFPALHRHRHHNQHHTDSNNNNNEHHNNQVDDSMSMMDESLSSIQTDLTHLSPMKSTASHPHHIAAAHHHGNSSSDIQTMVRTMIQDHATLNLLPTIQATIATALEQHRQNHYSNHPSNDQYHGSAHAAGLAVQQERAILGRYLILQGLQLIREADEFAGKDHGNSGNNHLTEQILQAIQADHQKGTVADTTVATRSPHK